MNFVSCNVNEMKYIYEQINVNYFSQFMIIIQTSLRLLQEIRLKLVPGQSDLHRPQRAGDRGFRGGKGGEDGE